MEDVLISKDLKVRPFIPDFSLRICENVHILRIRRKHWLAAVRATFFQNKQGAKGSSPMLNPDGEQIDLLAQELEKANCIDRPEINISPPSETTSRKRERAMSLTSTRSSGRAATQNKDFFKRLRSKSSSRSMDKIRPESRISSNFNTPTLTVKHNHYVSRVDQT